MQEKEEEVPQASPRACERCNERKVKCSKGLPTCKQCIRRNECCVYKSKRSSKASLQNESPIREPPPPNLVFVISGRAEPERPVLTYRSRQEFRLYKPIIFNSDKFKNKKEKKSSRNTSTAITKISPKLFIKLIGTTWLHYFVNLSGIQLRDWMQSNSDEVRVSFSRLTLIPPNLANASPRSSNRQLPGVKTRFNVFEVTISSDPGRKMMIESAILAYFEYFNPYCPLFSYSGFLSYTRSELLISVVIAIGLRCIEQDSETRKLLNVYLQRIMELINPTRRDWDLDYLQSLILVYLGLRGEGIQHKLLWLCGGMIVNLAHGLGLHMDSSAVSLSSVAQMERRLAYTTILQMDAIKNMLLAVPSMLFQTHSDLVRSGKLWHFDSETSFENACLMIASEFNWWEGQAAQQLSWCRQRIVDDNITYQQLEVNVMEISREVNNKAADCLARLTHMLSADLTPEQVEQINRITCYITIERIHVTLYTYSLHYKFRDLKRIKWDKENIPHSLTFGLGEAALLLNTSASLGESFFFPDRIQRISYAVIYIVRYATIYGDKSQLAITSNSPNMDYSYSCPSPPSKIQPKFPSWSILGVNFGLEQLHSLKSQDSLSARANFALFTVRFTAKGLGFPLEFNSENSSST